MNEKAGESSDRRGIIDYGEIVWGSCGEKTICIRNNGLATVPLRLAIMSVSMKFACVFFHDTYVIVFVVVYMKQFIWLVNDSFAHYLLLLTCYLCL